MCPPPLFVRHALQISSLLGGKGQIAAVGIMCIWGCSSACSNLHPHVHLRWHMNEHTSSGDLLEREIWRQIDLSSCSRLSPPFRIHFSLWSVADSCADQSTSCYAKGIWPVVTHCHRSRDLWLFLSANDAFWLGWFVFRQDRGRGSLPCARGQRWSVVKEV